ncbi:hypothetical protein H4W32_002003 [Actinophytocola algeriensis]|uniref:Uncharacterized protein n=1 Tax=Actinophytocola algeriensis TaxID=1768010 RepID=A0A7W7QCH0_9PSEU|nr:hypothetical protein [Actinophytocola algeriensis]MBE1473961.1 hypothetical protein [Actinophytocola algeriensis]
MGSGGSMESPADGHWSTSRFSSSPGSTNSMRMSGWYRAHLISTSSITTATWRRTSSNVR